VSHYEDILEIEEKLYKEYDELSIIPEICRRLDAHTYTIIDVDYSKWQDDLDLTLVAQLLVWLRRRKTGILYPLADRRLA